MRIFRILILVVIGSYLVSCASYFKRKECESTNWFEHGEAVALSGKSLESDRLLNECRKAEAQIGESALDQGYKKGRQNYCEPEGTFLTGKKGERFAQDMCDGHNLKVLRARYNAGVREFCQETNGESAGATGRPYQNVCPKDLESGFLVEFKKGRKKYLSAEIVVRENRIHDIDREISDLNENRMRKIYELGLLGGASGHKVKKRTMVNGRYGSQTYEEETVTAESAEKSMQRDRVKSDIDSLERQVEYKRRDQEKIREEIRALRSEALTL